MSYTQIAHAIRSKIIGIVAPAFDNIELTTEDILIDISKFNGDNVEATFSLQPIENVKRKDFQAKVEALQKQNPSIKTLKVKSKRPNHNVRFYLDYIANL